MQRFECPYLNEFVELTEERRRHIESSHPEILPQHEEHLALTLADPDEVRIDDEYPNTHLFIRWFEGLFGGKLVIVAVVSDSGPAVRHWIVTSFIARKPARGVIEWKRP